MGYVHTHTDLQNWTQLINAQNFYFTKLLSTLDRVKQIVGDKILNEVIHVLEKGFKMSWFSTSFFCNLCCLNGKYGLWLSPLVQLDPTPLVG